MKPTPHQEKKLSELYKWSNSTKPFYVLSGSAGTGKTFITKTFLDQCDKKVLLTATTHKAVGVLRESSGSYDCRTIHSALGLSPKRHNGKTYLSQDMKRATNNLRGVRIVVIDESSMVDTEMMKFIKQDAANNNRKYLFIGDHCQIPPVHEKDSPIFELMDTKPLTEIIRQAEGSPIITLATEIRDIIENGVNANDLSMNAITDIGKVETLSTEQFLEKIYNTDFMEDDNDDKVLSWTNASVKQYNKLVCESYGIKEDFVKGLHIVFSEAVMENDEIIVGNGEESIVDTVNYMTGSNGLPYYKITVTTHKTAFKVIPNDYFDEYEIFFDNLKNIAIKNPKKWLDFYRAKEEYSDIRPRFASSVHKAQGSTFNSVFVDLKDIQKCRDARTRYRLIYTAITRARHNVFIRV